MFSFFMLLQSDKILTAEFLSAAVLFFQFQEVEKQGMLNRKKLLEGGGKKVK